MLLFVAGEVLEMKTVTLLYCFLVFAFFLGINAYADIQEGLIIYFSFDEIDGNEVVNGSNAKINGTLEAKAEQVAGYKDMGVALNADAGEAVPGNDFVRVSDCPEVNVTEQFTITVWAKATNFGAYRTLLSKTDGGAYALTVENSVPTAWVHVKGDYLHVLGSTELKEDTWYHLALTFDGSDAIIYLDGEEEAKGTKEGNITICGADFMIGAEPSGQAVDPSYPAWHGVLDEFYFYDRVLTKEEIGLLIKQGSAVKPGDKLAASWGRVKKCGVQ